jgi:hypothetical protein
MIVIKDPSVVSSIAELEPYPEVRALVETRFTQLCEGAELTEDDPYDADMLGYFIIVQPRDSVAELEAESGCQILHNYFDPEICFGNPDFVHSADAIEDHGNCYEMTFILGGDFGIGIFVPKQEGIDADLSADYADLLAMCSEYAVSAQGSVSGSGEHHA